MKVLVTGARGMLGSDLCDVLSARHEVWGVDIEDFDITQGHAVRAAFSSYKPDLVIHCAAWTDVDGCEQNPSRAFQQNARGAQQVAAACAEINAAIVFISTDFVFDGAKGEPYTEFDQPHPLNVYGASKLAGERLVCSLVPFHYIVRTAWLYGARGKNFVRTILEKSVEQEELSVVDDQYGSPTYTRDLADAIIDLIVSEQLVPGTYHLTNSGICSWAELAAEALRLAGKPAKVRPIPATQWPSPTRRPVYSALRSGWLELQGIPPLRNWREALASHLVADKR